MVYGAIVARLTLIGTLSAADATAIAQLLLLYFSKHATHRQISGSFLNSFGVKGTIWVNFYPDPIWPPEARALVACCSDEWIGEVDWVIFLSNSDFGILRVKGLIELKELTMTEVQRI